MQLEAHIGTLHPQLLALLDREDYCGILRQFSVFEVCAFSCKSTWENGFNPEFGETVFQRLAQFPASIKGHSLLCGMAHYPDHFPETLILNPDRTQALNYLALKCSKIPAHWAGRVFEWVVINEFFADYGLKNHPLVLAVGKDDFLQTAFSLAREADPTAKLWIYDIAPHDNKRWDFILESAANLKAAGLIDGIGVQIRSEVGETPHFKIRGSRAAIGTGIKHSPIFRQVKKREVKHRIKQIQQLGLEAKAAEVTVYVGTTTPSIKEVLAQGHLTVTYFDAVIEAEPARISVWDWTDLYQILSPDGHGDDSPGLWDKDLKLKSQFMPALKKLDPWKTAFTNPS